MIQHIIRQFFSVQILSRTYMGACESLYAAGDNRLVFAILDERCCFWIRLSQQEQVTCQVCWKISNNKNILSGTFIAFSQSQVPFPSKRLASTSRTNLVSEDFH